MKVVVTPEAHTFINSITTEKAVLRMVGEAMSYDRQRDYTRHLALAKLHPYVRPYTWLENGLLGMCHWVAKDTVLLFLPPKDRDTMHRQTFFDEQFAISYELNIT